MTPWMWVVLGIGVGVGVALASANWYWKKHIAGGAARARGAATPLSYQWNIWSPGEECTVTEYGGPTGQRHLAGAEKAAALRIIQEDKAAVAAGAAHSTSIINADQRWYWYTIQPSRRSKWEVKLDENANEIPYPCPGVPAPPVDPRNFTFNLANVSVNGEFSRLGNVTQVKITTTGNLPQA
jgi:hypothetical protein